MGNLGMALIDKPLYQSKTVWTGIASIIGAVAGIYSGTVSPGEAAQLISQGLIAIFIRSAIKSI